MFKNNYFYKIFSLKEKLIFLTPPKCSTYSLSNFLVNSGIKLNEPLNFPKNFPFYHATLSEIVKAYNIISLDEYKIIQITRNPYDRFISSYIHEQKLLKKSINFDNYIFKIKKFKYLLPHNVNDFYKNFYKTFSYRDFYYNENSWGGLRFYFEQNWWNDLNKNIFYFKLEDIKNNSEIFSNFLNIKPLNYPKINSLKYDHINLNKNQKKEIYNLYKNDFKILNYGRI